jgi:transcription elongation factor Elf1
MKNHFYCPKCQCYLDIEDKLIFAVKSPDGNRGLVALSPELGDYNVKTNPHFNVEKGKKYEFYCPVCNTELASEVNENLTHLHMVDQENNEYEVMFSKIAGEQSTYTLIGENVSMYGEDSGNYIDFINLSSVK